MDTASSARTRKSTRDENFPVASWLIASQYRAPILAFYEFVRTADDVADHPTLQPLEKLRLLDQLEASLLGHNDTEPVALPLRSILRERGLTPKHALDLLDAFRLDIRKARYSTWDELIDYCRLSAMPVGRYVLDVHGESEASWPANDALCAALQIINHLQDCGEDFRTLDRVYLPLDAMQAAGADVADLNAHRSSPGLRRCLAGLAARTENFLDPTSSFAGDIRDWRLSLEVSVIHRLALRLTQLLQHQDPLSRRVHIGRTSALGITISALARRMSAHSDRQGAHQVRI
ncbi:squalene synthase HpnC [Microvirga terricola]|uniref:Squalene synthase HpnC n=1 Tax=Microvirga terricola TaxID=2719797 RepID=A0ABX0VEH3_9HYPH|nr:squalene synthase HpnC [Microvirga terricola]NIX78235.1 squalene synthase HpnC [Microvirga terricola]